MKRRGQEMFSEAKRLSVDALVLDARITLSGRCQYTTLE